MRFRDSIRRPRNPPPTASNTPTRSYRSHGPTTLSRLPAVSRPSHILATRCTVLPYNRPCPTFDWAIITGSCTNCVPRQTFIKPSSTSSSTVLISHDGAEYIKHPTAPMESATGACRVGFSISWGPRARQLLRITKVLMRLDRPHNYGGMMGLRSRVCSGRLE
jgi:hypothetical protein